MRSLGCHSEVRDRGNDQPAQIGRCIEIYLVVRRGWTRDHDGDVAGIRQLI